MNQNKSDQDMEHSALEHVRGLKKPVKCMVLIERKEPVKEIVTLDKYF